MNKFKKDLVKNWAKENKPVSETGQDRWYYINLKMVNKALKRILKEIDERILDIEVERKVFGHKVEVRNVWHSFEFGGDYTVPTLQYNTNGLGWEDLPYYSTNIEDAFLILKADKIPLDSFHLFFSEQYNPLTVRLEYRTISYIGEGETYQEAICDAALEYIKHAK